MKLFVRAVPLVQLRVIGITQDRRTPALLGAARALEQARLDKALQKRFDEGVRQKEGRGPVSRWFARPSALEHALTAPAGLRRQG